MDGIKDEVAGVHVQAVIALDRIPGEDLMVLQQPHGLDLRTHRVG